MGGLPMPWGTHAMVEKAAFLADWECGVETMTALCAAHRISRQAGYELLRRFHAEGVAGLQARSRAPHRSPGRLSAELAEAIVALRHAHVTWGPKKILAFLRSRQPDLAWPAASTIGELLKREGLIHARRRRQPQPVTRPFVAATDPNDLWSIDFKGYFRTRDNTRCDPLTVTDAVSRFLLACTIGPPTTAGVQPVVERLFREHGLPLAIRCDNGPPFGCSRTPAGLSRLSVGWLKLGIRVEYIDPGCPQQNGRHERMHRTLKQETARPPAATPAEQQARFDAFRCEYNNVRPHEALEQATPARHWRSPSPRPCPDHVDEPWYDPEHAVRRVRSGGEIKWGGELIFISEALVGEPVGITETQTGDWLVRFMDLDLGIIDRRRKTLFRYGPPRPQTGRAAPEQTGKTVTHVSGL